MRSALAILAALVLAWTQPRAADNIEGLWAYETLARRGGPPVQIAGLFVFKDGRFVQQSVNAGEPYEQQLAQAHAGTYRFENARLRMLAEVGVVVDPPGRKPVEWRDDSVHEVTFAETADRLTLTFETGTVQTFRRVGPGRGELIDLDRGALALIDGRFLLAARGQGRATSGSGTYERHDDALQLHAERWISIRGERPAYARNRTMAARLTSSALTIDGEEWARGKRR